MNDLIYTILWIDDEHEKLDSIKRTAIDFNIQFNAFKSLTAGLDELEKNYDKYDGVLLDAKFYEREDDVPGSEDRDNSIEAKSRIDQLDKKFDIHVFTGQSEAFGDGTYKKFFKKIFRKGVDQDEEKLFESLRLSAAAHKDNQLKHQYKDVFQVATDAYLGKDLQASLIQIAQALVPVNKIKFTPEHLTAIRKIIETLIHKLAQLNLIPPAIAQKSGWISGASLFISNKHKDYQHTQTYFHPLIAHTFHRLLDVLQDGSHSQGELKLKVDEYLKNTPSQYLIQACVFQLFELLVWAKSFMDSYPNQLNNQSLWELKNNPETNQLNQDVIGTIQQDSFGNYYCNGYLLDYRYTHQHHKIGDQIKITEIADNLNEKSNYMYPKRAHKYESC
jgi:hypothetical protein